MSIIVVTVLRGEFNNNSVKFLLNAYCMPGYKCLTVSMISPWFHGIGVLV